MANRFQLKGTTASTWATANPILAAREPGIETDTGYMKVGDGTTAWSSLPYMNKDVPEHEWSGTQLRFKLPNGTWGSYVDLGENVTDVTLSDNGDGTVNLTFVYDIGGSQTVTTPDISGRVVNITKVDNPDGSIDLTFENSYGGTFTITTPVLGTNADTVDGYDADLVAATIPAHYSRSERWRAKSEAARTTITTPSTILVNINGTGYKYTGPTEIDLDTTSLWDDITYQTPANRAGKDFYIYACVPSSGQEMDVVLSANSTTPSGYTADNSRKIGGFHCLTETVGSNGATTNGDITLWPLDEVYDSHTISGNTHWLNGYQAGDILPFSIWDLLHRPACSPEGMVYDPWSNKWVDIYLASWASGQLQSVDGGTILDGASSTPGHFHWYNFAEHFSQIKKRLPYRAEFMAYAIGVPQGVNVSGGTDQGTTTGHTATDGNRIISNIGVEDAVGVMWQWGNDMGATNDQGSAWEPADTNDTVWAYDSAANPEGDTGSYDHIKGIRRGGHYEDPNRPVFGGYWSAGARCGSRIANWDYRALLLASVVGARGVSEPLGRRS